MTAVHLRDERRARALGYCMVDAISRDALYEVLENFPQTKKQIQEASLQVAFARAMTVVALYSRLAKRRERSLSFDRAVKSLSETSMSGGRRHSVDSTREVSAKVLSVQKRMREKSLDASEILHQIHELLEISTPWRDLEKEKGVYLERASARAGDAVRAPRGSDNETSPTKPKPRKSVAFMTEDAPDELELNEGVPEMRHRSSSPELPTTGRKLSSTPEQ